MAISFTYHGPNRAADAAGQKADAIGKAIGNRVDVADSAVSSALIADGWYRIVASTSSYVRIDPAATNGTNGEHFPAGQVEVRYLAAGDKIGVSAV